MSLMQFEVFEVGLLGTNCYLCWDLDTRHAIVIDPGWEDPRILSVMKSKNLILTHIVNTHGHADHIGGNQWLKQKTGAELWIHSADAHMLLDANANLSRGLGVSIVSPPADRELKEGVIVTLGAHKLTVLETPGHSQGSICLLGPAHLFAGDTLFAQSIGRTDLPGGDTEQILGSIKNKLMTLSDTLEVFPGHGAATTIGFERKNNPYLSAGIGDENATL